MLAVLGAGHTASGLECTVLSFLQSLRKLGTLQTTDLMYASKPHAVRPAPHLKVSYGL